MTTADSCIDISVVIPCYRSSESIMELHDRIVSTLDVCDDTYEIIYVNDCSPDDTMAKLKEISKSNANVRAVDLMYNVGQFRALICGFEISRGKFIITMDDDLQHPPEEMIRLYSYLQSRSELDAVFGSYESKKHSIFRNIGSYAIRKINEKVFNKPKNLKMSSFRCLRRSVVQAVVNHRTLSPVLGPLILKSTSRIENVEVRHDSRKYGTSNYSLFKLVQTTFDNVLNFSSLPLSIIGFIGVSISVLSFLVFLVILFKYLLGRDFLPGWTSTVLLINFYFGIVLFSIGIIGEYLIRILKEVSGSPRYQIRDVFESGSKKD